MTASTHDSDYKDLIHKAEVTLRNTYNSLPLTKKSQKVTCIKLNLSYHEINVALYYDNYLDIENMILKLEYDHQVYLGNIHLGKFIQDLNKEPVLCQRLLRGKNLKPFYEKIATKILNNEISIVNYPEDYEFLDSLQLWHTTHLRDNIHVHPQLFLRTFRRSNMSKNMFNSLIDDNKISRETVLAIKNSGYTVVRTDNPLERNSLTTLLNQHNIN